MTWIAVGVADHHERLAPDKRPEIIAGVLHLALVADINPGGAENPFELKIEVRIGVDLPMNAARLNKP